MKLSKWESLKQTLSRYSSKTAHYYRLVMLKGDIHMFKRKKNIFFRDLGKTIYEALLNNHTLEDIINRIQPILSEIDSLDSQIEAYQKEIHNISTQQNIASEDVEKIEGFFNIFRSNVTDDEETHE